GDREDRRAHQPGRGGDVRRRQVRPAAWLLALAFGACLRPPGAEPQSAANAPAPPGATTVSPPPAPVAAKPSLAARAVPGLPAAIAWTSSAPIIVPKSDAAHALLAVKDPTVVRFNGRWHVYASS